MKPLLKSKFRELEAKKKHPSNAELDTVDYLEHSLHEIRRVLNCQKITKRELANRMGISLNTLRYIFSGTIKIQPIYLIGMAAALGLEWKKPALARKKTKEEIEQEKKDTGCCFVLDTAIDTSSIGDRVDEIINGKEAMLGRCFTFKELQEMFWDIHDYIDAIKE